jgi:hypothetical protein
MRLALGTKSLKAAARTPRLAKEKPSISDPGQGAPEVYILITMMVG